MAQRREEKKEEDGPCPPPPGENPLRCCLRTTESKERMTAHWPDHARVLFCEAAYAHPPKHPCKLLHIPLTCLRASLPHYPFHITALCEVCIGHCIYIWEVRGRQSGFVIVTTHGTFHLPAGRGAWVLIGIYPGAIHTKVSPSYARVLSKRLAVSQPHIRLLPRLPLWMIGSWGLGARVGRGILHTHRYILFKVSISPYSLPMCISSFH